MSENNLPQQQPQYIYVQQPRYNDEDEVEIDLIELFKAIWKKKWLILFLMIIGGGLGAAYALQLPFIYKAEARIMPAGGGGGGGRLSGLMSQYGGIASMMGISMPEGSGGSGAVMIDVMKGNSVVDAIIDKFNLMEEMKQEYRINARKAVLKNFEAESDTKGSGIITLSYVDTDPQKAADIVNAFIDELQKKMTEMSLSQVQQKRAFYETQLMEVQKELSDAEEAMMKYQQSSGVIVMEEQAKALLDAIKNLRSQIAAKNIEISSMKSYARRDNPMLKLAQSELSAMQKELSKLEEEQKRTDTGRAVPLTNENKNTMISVGEIPEISVEYQHYLRALKVAEAKYEFMFSQFESARLGEISDFSTITVVDPAMPPDFRDGPSRTRISLIGVFIGFFLPTGWISGKFVVKESKKQKKKKDDDEDDDDNEY